MALDINGYNATFKAFTDFATQSVKAGDTKAIARAGGEGALAGRTITAAQGDSLRHIFKWTRSEENQSANNITRDLFKQAIIDMFGGEKNIPKSVMKAMLMSDYGKGKPLTARRIIAVKNAIDASGVMKQKGIEETMLPKALDKGYAKGEMPKLAKAANLLAQANGCSVEQAFEEVSTPGSKANRLMNYGGRFMQSADNFKNGLRLIDSFEKWMTDTYTALKSTEREDFNAHTGLTVLNGSWSYINPDNLRSMEKFVFEDFAVGNACNLAEKNPEKLFGLENNSAMRFFGRGLCQSYTQTVANIPPEKRCVFYAALDAAFPLVSDLAIAKLTYSERPDTFIAPIDRSTIIGRVMKNFDKLEGLMTDGKISTEVFVKTCFPEAKTPTLKGVNDLLKQWTIEMGGDDDNDIPPKYPKNLTGPMGTLMETTGCTIEEAFAALQKGGVRPPTPKYVATGTLSLGAFDGTLKEAREQLAGDLIRPAQYSMDDKQLLSGDGGFKFKFPDGSSYKTNNSQEGRAQIPDICDKVEKLCGSVHLAQASSTMMMLCQSGLGPLLGGLNGYGIVSSEHSAVNFELSKNETTGDISIRYSSPEELPFAFEWTATIKTDGYVSTTPIRFTDEKALATLKLETTEAAAKLKESTLASYREKPYYDPAQEAMIAGEIGKSVDAIFSGVGADRDMLTLLQTNKMAEGVLSNAAQRIRSPEKVAKTVAGLKGNLDELRAAANGNQRIFDVGLKHIANFGGTALKSGILTKMCEMIAKEDLGAFRNLSAASSPEKIMDAMCRLDRLIAKIFDETEILMNIGEVGQSETNTAKGLVMGLVFAHCGEDAVNGIKSALESPNATRLESVLMDMGNGKFPPGASVEPQTRIAISNYADMFNMSFRYEMYGALNDALGIDNANVDMLEARDDKTPVSPKSENAILDTMKEYTLVMEERRISRPNLADLPPQGA